MSKKMSINICMGSSCFARGNMTHLELIENIIRDYGLNADVNLEGGRCYDKCADSPHIIADGISYDKITASKIVDIMKKNFPQIEREKYIK